MQVCNSLAGFSIQDGYVMIKAVGKKKESLLKKFEKQFVEGCVKNGVPKNVAQEYWTRFITPFAAYGFNLAHALSYSVLSYICAYLKANFPDEFFCSLLNVENIRRNYDKISEYEKDAQERGIIISQKDLNKCDVEYRIIKKRDPKNDIQNTVIAPSLAVKGIGANSAKEIVLKRPFKNLRDMAGRTNTSLVDKEVITNLVQEGFFDQEYHTELGKGKKISKTKFREALIAKFLSIRNDLKKLGSKGMPDFDLFEGE
jgi:DNA polymerase-3 subunit alpha